MNEVNVIRARTLADFSSRLAGFEGGMSLRLNRNRRTLLSLRWHAGWRLSLHEDMLDDAAALDDIVAWVAKRGRGRYPALNAAMRRVVDEHRQRERADRGPLPFPLLEPLGGALDLGGAFTRVHATWFAHLPKPRIDWSRGSLRRSQRHIRFGCYRRRPQPAITIHPRLDQPWVARAFVDHVLFHELCHHAQACAPLRGETAHSKRFRAWERSFPLHADVLAWEAAHLDRFLEATSWQSRAV
jgi:hypothetical protein